MEKVDHMKEQLGNVIIEMKTPEMNQKERLEIKNTITEVKNASN